MVGRFIIAGVLLGTGAAALAAAPGSVKWGGAGSEETVWGAQRPASISRDAPAPDRIWAPPGVDAAPRSGNGNVL